MLRHPPDFVGKLHRRRAEDATTPDRLRSVRGLTSTPTACNRFQVPLHVPGLIPPVDANGASTYKPCTHTHARARAGTHKYTNQHRPPVARLCPPPPGPRFHASLPPPSPPPKKQTPTRPNHRDSRLGAWRRKEPDGPSRGVTANSRPTTAAVNDLPTPPLPPFCRWPRVNSCGCGSPGSICRHFWREQDMATQSHGHPLWAGPPKTTSIGHTAAGVSVEVTSCSFPRDPAGGGGQCPVRGCADARPPAKMMGTPTAPSAGPCRGRMTITRGTCPRHA